MNISNIIKISNPHLRAMDLKWIIERRNIIAFWELFLINSPNMQLLSVWTYSQIITADKKNSM